MIRPTAGKNTTPDRSLMATPRYHSVEDYLTSLQDPVKEDTLRIVIGHILTTFPELEAKIAWNVPTVHRRGKYVAGICAYRRHLTFSPWSPQIIQDFGSRLSPLVVMKNCFQLPIDWPLDPTLITDLVQARLAQLDCD